MNSIHTIWANLNAIADPHAFMAAALSLGMGLGAIISIGLLIGSVLCFLIASRMGWIKYSGTADTGLR